MRQLFKEFRRDDRERVMVFLPSASAATQFRETRRMARGMTRERTRALTELVPAVAADVRRTRRVVHSIKDRAERVRTLALLAVAHADDPVRSGRLIAEAERITKRGSGRRSERGTERIERELANLPCMAAATHPAEAESISGGIGNLQTRVKALLAVIPALSTDPGPGLESRGASQ